MAHLTLFPLKFYVWTVNGVPLRVAITAALYAGSSELTEALTGGWMLAATSLMSRRSDPPQPVMRTEWIPLYPMTRCSELVLLHPLIGRSPPLHNNVPSYYQPTGLRRRPTIYRLYMKQVNASSTSRTRCLTCDCHQKKNATAGLVRLPSRALLPWPPQ